MCVICVASVPPTALMRQICKKPSQCSRKMILISKHKTVVGFQADIHFYYLLQRPLLLYKCTFSHPFSLPCTRGACVRRTPRTLGRRTRRERSPRAPAVTVTHTTHNMDTLIILLAFATVTMAQFYGRPEYTRTALGDSIDLSTMKVLKESFEAQENKNIVLSPLGVMTLLSLYNVGAGREASRQLSQFLGTGDAKQTSTAYKELNTKLSGINPDHLTVANMFAVDKHFELSDALTSAGRDYGTQLESVNFLKPEETANKINQWAAEKTKGHITKPVDKDSLTEDMVAALFNVIFFKGDWHVPFDVKDTKEKDFYLTKSNVTKKQMMHLHQSLYYTASEQLGAKMIELPYKQNGFRMVVVLPDEVDGLPSVLQKAAEKGLLSDVYQLQEAGRDVDLDMPKFDVRTKIDFHDVLTKCGVGKIFEEAAPGLVKETSVKISKVFQEAFIKVNEEGATAGAFTGTYLIAISDPPILPEPMKFTVDHPFLYAILHEDKILFAGTYSGSE